MKKYLFAAAFLLGALAVAWVGVGFIHNNVLALAMTLGIGAVYSFGVMELKQFRSATATLLNALEDIPEPIERLSEWLASVHPSLQNSVRLRIEGERVGLPGPVLTPYLVGLLVMLGMLGTFLGMVVTLNGAVFALEATTDLQAIRTSLAAPIKGLGLAFGTSVAGVAASAMLGLMSALSRRERMQAAHLLDTKAATVLRGFSLAHQRQETFKALQIQSRALPEMVEALRAMMNQFERMGHQMSAGLVSSQDSFHREVKTVYTDLARSVDKSLRDSMIESARTAGASIQPIVEVAMTGIARDAQLMHERMVGVTQSQMIGLTEKFHVMVSDVSEQWAHAAKVQEQTNTSLASGLTNSLAEFNQTLHQRSEAHFTAVSEAFRNVHADQATTDRQRMEAWVQSLASLTEDLQDDWKRTSAQTLSQQREVCTILTQTAHDITEHAQSRASNTLAEASRLMASTEELIHSRIRAEADWIQNHGQRMDQVAEMLRTELGALRDEEATRANAAVARLGELHTAVATHLTTLGTALEDPIARLIQTASEAPRAAAEVIGQLRQEISNSVARDNDLLEERSRILETLHSLLKAINHASAEQRNVIESLVVTSAQALNQTGQEFSDKVGVEAARFSEFAAQINSSALDVSSLSDAFGFAVRSFNDANEKLIANLQRIESAMDKSMTRSDDQLAYYVAQAREIIDMSILSQREMMEGVRQLPGQKMQVAKEAQ